jgi:hypothetical protein
VNKNIYQPPPTFTFFFFVEKKKRHKKVGGESAELTQAHLRTLLVKTIKK